jgi:hypothetical protein
LNYWQVLNPLPLMLFYILDMTMLSIYILHTCIKAQTGTLKMFKQKLMKKDRQ